MTNKIHQSEAGSINALWRALMSSPSQLALSRLLKANLGNILASFNKAGLVDLSHSEILEITNAPDEINKIGYLFLSKRYTQARNGGSEPIRAICRNIQKPEYFSKFEMPARQVSALRRRAEDLLCACSTLVHCRNVNAHENYPIDDPGFALMLAGSIARVIEVADISDDLQPIFTRMRQQCDTVLQASITMSASGENSDIAERTEPRHADDSIAPLLESLIARLDDLQANPPVKNERNRELTPAQQNRTITANDLGATYITGQIKRQNESLASKIASEIQSLPTIAEIQLIIQGAVDAAARKARSEIDVENQFETVLSSFEDKVEEIRKSVSAASDRTDEERVALQDALDRKIEALREISSSGQFKRLQVDSSDEYFFDEDEPYGTTSAPPAITPQQARNQLFQLRNRIRDDAESAGDTIENWENILQGPIIERMVGDRIMSIEEWHEEPMIASKYKDNEKIMKRQLAEYQSEIFKIMEQIDG